MSAEAFDLHSFDPAPSLPNRSLASDLDLGVTPLAIEGRTIQFPLDRLRGIPPTGDREGGFVAGAFVAGPFAVPWRRTVALGLKRLIDVVGASLGLVVLSPLLLTILLLVAVFDGYPTLFSQVRVGRDGRHFRLYKFRTMVTDAEARLESVRHLNERSRVAFKAANDPRVTALGRWLRRTSIDELPQLWNVLTGSMSLVGPRPPLTREVVEYETWHRRRLTMKPGITGLWQVEARTDPDFDRWVARDLAYIDGWSIWLDLRILARTIPAVLKCDGR